MGHFEMETCAPGRIAVKPACVFVCTACYDVNTSSDKWLSRLDSCGWLSHIKDALTCACVAAQCVDKEAAMVLVHGSDGSDTTVVVTSLAQLILDPDCRTVTG